MRKGKNRILLIIEKLPGWRFALAHARLHKTYKLACIVNYKTMLVLLFTIRKHFKMNFNGLRLRFYTYFLRSVLPLQYFQKMLVRNHSSFLQNICTRVYLLAIAEVVLKDSYAFLTRLLKAPLRLYRFHFSKSILKIFSFKL